MNYLYGNEWHDVPQYTNYPACRLVAVQYAIPLARIVPRDQRLIKPNWRKVWKFIGAEGVARTFKKIQSKRAQAKLNGDFHVVVAIGIPLADAVEETAAVEAATPLLCLGTRHPRCAGVMLFRRELTVSLPFSPPADRCIQAIEDAERRLGSSQNGWERFGGYNFYSDEAPPDNCTRFVQAVALCLTQESSAAKSSAAAIAARYRAIQPEAAQARAKSVAVSPAQVWGSGVAVIAAGDYVRTQIAPVLQRSGISLNAVVDREPFLAEYVRQKFGFKQALTNWREAVARPETEIVIVASYHDSHALIAAEALRCDKKVLVEKPPVVNREDLELLLEAASREDAFLEVGFNRRFAPFTQKAKELLRNVSGPTTILCVVKEVEIPDEHWYRWPKEGTRITGNICHWIDLAIYLLGPDCQPFEMTVTGQAGAHPDEELGLNILLRDGSTINIIVTSRGDGALGVQELIEVRRDDLTVRIVDFRSMRATRSGKVIYDKRGLREKGHAAMYRESIARMKGKLPAHYTLQELRLTSLLTINATEMVRHNIRSMTLDL
jgi:predicted dehydrogenase